MTILPSIQSSLLDQHINDNREYLFVIYDEYFGLQAELGEDLFFRRLNTDQHAFLAYNYLYGEVTNGGFIQLIQNGYGSYIFESPCIDTLEQRGLSQTTQILKQAKVIYQQHKKLLEQETNLKGFSDIYEQITDFEPLEDMFYDIMDGETTIFASYIKNNISSFVKLT